jgi:hypothetical protein
MKSFKKMILIGLVIFGSLAVFSLPAVTAQKVAVEIRDIVEGTDSVGARLLYQIKEGIRRSSGLRLTNSNEPKLVVYIETLKVPTRESVSAIATVYVYSNMKSELFLGLQSLMCGGGRVNEIAETIIANIDKQAEPYRK